MDDLELLQVYARQGAEEAFAMLVGRHINLVYASALRQTRQPQMAEEIAQVVFIILARKAATLRPGTILAGWLLRTTRYTAANARRREQRRCRIEREAYTRALISQGHTSWEKISACVDEGLLKLRDGDRNAIVLHFFEGKSYKEIGSTLGLSENTARMRVSRAIERLRAYLARKGLDLGHGWKRGGNSDSEMVRHERTA